MTENEYSTEMELYGVSPTIIGMIMFSITVIVPFGYVSDWIGLPWGVIWSPMIYSLFWGFNGYRFVILSVQDITALVPFTFLNWLYAYWIVRYYQAKRTGFAVVAIGLISLFLPGSIAIIWYLLVGANLAFIYPIPIQFILGLLILQRIEGPEVISPWSGVRLDFSWWRWKRAPRTKIKETDETEKVTPTEEEWLDE